MLIIKKALKNKIIKNLFVYKYFVNKKKYE